MRRTKINDYLDIVPTHPEWTDEDYDRAIEEADKESEKLTEWPKM